MYSHTETSPCTGFPMAVLYPDVEPEVLAREAANEASRVSRQTGTPWHSYLRRVLPALEHSEPVEMAQALLAAGTGPDATRTHALRMRRQAVAAGDVHRARFWADVAGEVGRLGRS